MNQRTAFGDNCRVATRLALALVALFVAGPGVVVAADTLDPTLVAAEEARIATARKITPATIAIFDQAAESGGSGAIITADGLAVTNYHVVAPCGAFMKVGLADGRLVDAVLVGVDPPGDVALIQLVDLQAKEKQASAWPVAEWGDSDRVVVGDEAFVAGNPFLLAHDFRPTITHGVISGVHRYQYPAGTLLEYADCLQTDAAINPGNSGGPLYNAAGQLIGVNGRASFEKRGRVNVGVGYAISANQVRRFVSHLASGRIVDHATLGLTVRTVGGKRAVIDQIRATSDAYRRGLRYGDTILRVGGREIRTANALQNTIGTYPPGWRLKIEYQRGFETQTAVVRLERGHGAAELEELVGNQLLPRDGDGKPRPSAPSNLDKSLAALYESRVGYTNYHFNRKTRDALLAACPQSGQLPPAGRELIITGLDVAGAPITLRLTDAKAEFDSPRGRFWAKLTGPRGDQLGPPGSGGLLAALGEWRSLLAGDADLAAYTGLVPWGPSLALYECIMLSRDGLVAEVFFDRTTGDLVGLEMAPDRTVDPCRIEFADFRLGKDGRLPARMMVSRGDEPWLEFSIERYAAKSGATDPYTSQDNPPPAAN